MFPKRKIFLLALVLKTLNIMASEYDVKAIYQKQDLPYGTKALCSYGRIEDASSILVPIKMEKGKYIVKLTRVESNLYKINGTDCYIETKFCYEMTTYEDVILIINGGTFTVGKVIFD